MDPRLLKKPKLEEPSDINGDESGRERGDGGIGGGGGNDPDALQEQEEALVALIEHRSKEYEHLKQKVAYFKSQVCSPSFNHPLFCVGLVCSLSHQSPTGVLSS